MGEVELFYAMVVLAEVLRAGYAAVVEVERLGGICHPIWLVSFSSGSQPLTVTGGLVAGIGRTPLSG